MDEILFVRRSTDKLLAYIVGQGSSKDDQYNPSRIGAIGARKALKTRMNSPLEGE